MSIPIYVMLYPVKKSFEALNLVSEKLVLCMCSFSVATCISPVLPLFFSILSLSSNAQTFGNEWIDYSKQYFKFGIREQRFFRIPVSTLSSVGLATVPVEHFQLWRDGEEVPLFTSVPSGPLPFNGFIEFFGKPNSGRFETDLYQESWHHTEPTWSFFGDTAWYYLTVNPSGLNKRFVTAVNNVASTVLPPDSFYMHTINGLAGTGGFNFGAAQEVNGILLRSSIWDRGEGFSTNGFSSTGTIQFNLTGLRAFRNGPDMQLTYAVAGNNSASRNVLVRLNDEAFDSVFVSQFDLKVKTINQIPSVRIVNDAINFKFNSDNPLWSENVTVNSFRLRYPRRFFHNQISPLEIILPANDMGNHIRLAGLPNSNVPPVLYDMTHLKRYVGVIRTDSSLFAIEPSLSDRVIVLGTQVASHLRTITTLTPLLFRDLRLPQNQGNYLIISNRILRRGPTDMVEAYRNYRSTQQGGGYLSAAYDIDEIADQFAYGTRKSPLAIRRFIHFALNNFSEKPRMVLILGRGSVYRSAAFASGVNAELLNGVPTWGHPGSDNLLAAASNRDPVPLIPIGRVAAISPDEIKAYLDKVKEFDSLQQQRPLKPSDNAWRKKILQLIGGSIEEPSGENFEITLIENFFRFYERFLEAPKAGGQSYIFQSVENPSFAQDMHFIEKSISEGAGLIKYFGHSSSSSLDFNLGSPDQFNNLPGRYPIYYANGCRAGSIFDYDTRRLTAREVSISDNFTFAPGKGSIAFISSSDFAEFSPQNLISRNWTAIYANTMFGKTLGEIQQRALREAFNLIIPEQPGFFSNKITIEQMVLHGDPAIVPFPHQRPDFAVESAFIKPTPGDAFTELDSVKVMMHIFNLGEARNDNVTIALERQLPNGDHQLLFRKKLSSLYNVDSIVLTFPLKGLFEEGSGSLIARIDPENIFVETDEDNNTAIIPFILDRHHVKPVWPYNLSIVNQVPVTFKASTTNPAEKLKNYIFQIDTTTSFSSPFAHSIEDSSVGGILTFKPSINYQADAVYYWRVLLKDDPFPSQKTVFSFLHKPESLEGTNQSHFFQHKNSTTSQIDLGDQGKWVYKNRLNNLYCNHGIYLLSGFEDSHFSLTVNGSRISRSACLGRSIIFNLFDPQTFEPWRNSGGDFGSSGICGPGREFNYEFRYSDYTNRRTIMDFLDQVPKGTYVAARLVVDPPFDSIQARFWMRDTVFFGPGKSLYHTLKNQGFYELDSLNRTRTFFFLFKKDDSLNFKPFYRLSRGTVDRVFASVYAPASGSSGSIESPWMGYATQWKQAEWQISNLADTLSTMRLELWARTLNNDTVKVKEWTRWADKVDISDLQAGKYPFLQFRLHLSNKPGSQIPQINFWRIYYNGLADGAWSARDYFQMRKTILKPNKDTLDFSIAFKNTSTVSLDTQGVKITIIDDGGNVKHVFHAKLKSLLPGDTTIFSFQSILEMPEGAYSVLLEANEGGKPAEQYYFNNRALLHFEVDGSVLPNFLLNFDVHKKGSASLISWTISDNEDLKSYSVEHSEDGREFWAIQDKPVHTDNSAIVRSYEILHQYPKPGWNYYRLRLNHKNDKITYSEVKRIFFEKENSLRIFPNPFHDSFTIQPATDKEWQIRIFDVSGRLVILQKATGVRRVDLSRAPSGTYFIEYTDGHISIHKKIMKH